MRSAPAVTVRCTGGALWCALLWLLPSLAAAAATAWAALHVLVGRGAPAIWALAPAVLAFALVAAWAQRWRPAPARLTWDGAVWTCNDRLVRPQVMLDTGGSWLLLRLRSVGVPTAALPTADGADAPPPAWLAVHRLDAAAAWTTFRAAVYCPAPLTDANSSTRQTP